jgi:hypothetical protein
VELAEVPSVAIREHQGTTDRAELEMENDKDNTRGNAKQFRDYAAECRRLAQRAPEKDRAVLMEIADAWIACAEEAERKEKAGDDNSGR